MRNLRELLVGRRGEAPLVPPYTLCNFKLDVAVAPQGNRPQSSNETSSQLVESVKLKGEPTCCPCP